VRLKNKGSRKRSGRKYPKYQAPIAEDPQTDSKIDNHQIHANLVEAFNAALRWRNSAFRRKTNLDAKSRDNLQRTLDVQWLVHHFVRVHFTTKVSLR
jgi:IS1 family transposase